MVLQVAITNTKRAPNRSASSMVLLIAVTLFRLSPITRSFNTQIYLAAILRMRLQRQVHTPQLSAPCEERLEEGTVGSQHPLVGGEGAMLTHQNEVNVAQVRLEETLLVQQIGRAHV